MSLSEISRFRLAVICSTALILLSFVLSYLLLGHNGLPIGWDTPYYITRSKIVASQGLQGLVSVQGPYDILYELVAGFFVWAGVSATNVEIFLPMTLACIFPYLLGRLTLVNSNLRLASFVVLTTPAWYAVYSIGAGLHANLLGMILLLAALVLSSNVKLIRSPRALAGLTLVGLASFTHIETTVFLTTIVLISSLPTKRLFPTRMAILFVVIATPAAVLFALHFLALIGLTGGAVPYLPPESAWFWLTIFGPLFPLAAIGLYTSIRHRISSLEVFVATWALASIGTGVFQYLVPQTFIFAQRAAILVPVPFLAALGFKELQSRVDFSSIHSLNLRFSGRWIQIALVVLLMVSWPVTYIQGATQDQKVFLSSSAYTRLEWIHNNLHFGSPLIFVYTDMDPVAGELADFYDNWVSAIVGTHLAYVGQIGYLVQLQETPYSNIISREMSAKFMDQLRNSGVTNSTLLLQHQVVLVEDFYNPAPIPAYVTNLFTQISAGIFVGNSTRLGTLNSVTLPAYSSYVSAVGPWNPTNQTWTQSWYALETNVSSIPTNIQATYLITASASRTYAVGVRYLDVTSSGLSIILDGTTIGSIHYANTRAPVLGNFSGIYMTQGVHMLTISVNKEPGVIQYASLDYLVVTQF